MLATASTSTWRIVTFVEFKSVQNLASFGAKSEQGEVNTSGSVGIGLFRRVPVSVCGSFATVAHTKSMKQGVGNC